MSKVDDTSMRSLELAKNLQFDIELLSDPMEIAYAGQDAIGELSTRFPGCYKSKIMAVRALGVYVFNYGAKNELPGYSYRFDNVECYGIGRGFGFIMSVGGLGLKSIFLGVGNGLVLDADTHIQKLGQVKGIIVPVLEIDEIT